jgi:hypothetical protein
MPQRSQDHLSKSNQHASRRHCCTALTFIVGEVVLHRAHWELLLESVDLVQEKNDAGLDKPPGVADAVKKRERLLHSVDGLVFEEQLVVFRNGNQEENSGDVFKAMNPLLSFRSLPTNVEHTVRQVLDDESSLGDTGGLYSGSQDILIVGKVVVSSDAIDRVKVARARYQQA